MGKIMVVRRDALFGNDYFEGFRHRDEADYEKRIIENFQYMEREEAEKNEEYKQPIAYAVIIDPVSKKIFAYQRSSEHYDEKRLHGKWSCGVGGHIEKIDIKNGNPIIESMIRELKEEIEIRGNIKPQLLGYINDESSNVNKVHFGLLFVIETAENIKPKSPEIKTGGFITLDELEKLCSYNDVEQWSRISLNPIRNYIALFTRR